MANTTKQNCEEEENYVKQGKMKKRIQWTPDAEEVLINIWAEKFDELNTRPNAHIREEVVSILDSLGYPFSANEIKIKIHNLKNRYREERKKIALSGGSERSTWPLFQKVHSILGKHKTYEFENDNSMSQEFAFVQSDSLMENELLSEDELPSISKPVNAFTQRKVMFKHNANAESGKRKYSEVTNGHDFSTNFKNDKFDEAASSSNCLNKLAKTVDDVVNFMMKTENNKSRNASFLNVLDSYLVQLPENTQDKVKIELLNTVFNKIKTDKEAEKEADKEIVEESSN